MRSHAEMQPIYSRVFKSRDGEAVLMDLMDRYYNNRIKDETMARQVGQRDVMMHILMMLQEQT